MRTARIILVGFDYSPLSEAALDRALQLAATTPYTTLHAVTVGDRVDSGVRLPGGALLTEWAATQAVRTQLEERVRALLGTGSRRLRVIGHLRSGEPARAILDLALTSGAERIVLGAHSDPDTNRLTLGSVALSVTAQSSVEVHLETALPSAPTRRPPADPVRWAFVFGAARGRNDSPWARGNAPVNPKA